MEIIARMMDDFRPARQPMPRRDYSGPTHRPMPQPPRPHHSPPHPPTQPPATPQPQNQPAPHHVYQRPATYPIQSAARQATIQPKKRLGLRYFSAGAALVLAIGLFTAGYLLKSKSPDKTIPSAIVTKAKYDVYFPSPMPPGYIYVSKTATFQIGDVFYRFANGPKSVTVREEPLSAQKPDLKLYKGYTLFDTGSGQAAIGLTFGQPQAVILTPTTVITMNTSGGVTSQDLHTAIDNLHNIGSSSQAASHG